MCSTAEKKPFAHCYVFIEKYLIELCRAKSSKTSVCADGAGYRFKSPHCSTSSRFSSGDKGKVPAICIQHQFPHVCESIFVAAAS